MTDAFLATRNLEWGYFGALQRTETDQTLDVSRAWTDAMAAVTAATGAEPDDVRAFLDSRHGRHFADDVTNGFAAGEPLASAIDAAVARWMTWRIGRRTSRETGIPQGLPYLTGAVEHCGIFEGAG